MKLGNIEEMVTITGQVAQIDVKSTTKGMTLTKEVFQTLPKGRNFDSLITAIPGVAVEPMLGGTSVDGASGLENMYYIDGTDVTNIVSGANGQSASFDFVDEVQVKASGYQAEFGGSLGGVINVVTRSGGNEFHGEVIGFYSGAPLRAAYSDRLNLDKSDSSQAKYYSYVETIGDDNDHQLEAGFNVGGYIFKDKLWFFGSFLPVYYTNTRTVDYGGGTVKDYKQTSTNWNYQAKLTAQPVKNLRLTASVVNNFYKYKGNLDTAFGGNPNPTVSPDDFGFSYPNFSGSAAADYTLGNNFMLSLRGGYFMNNQNKPLVAPSEPRWRFLTEAPGGYFNTTNVGLLDVPAEYQRTTGFSSTASNPFLLKKALQREDERQRRHDLLHEPGRRALLEGRRAVRAPGRGLRQLAVLSPGHVLAWNRSYEAYGTNYGRGKYGYYAIRGNEDAGPYGSFYKAYSNRWALYLQDSWTIANRVTINFGLRTESEYIPSYSDNPDFKDVKPISWGFGDKLAPRLGFVWDVNGDSSLKVFGSAGLFYDVMKLSMANGSYGGFKWKSAVYALDTYKWNEIGKEGWNYGTPLAVFDFRIPSFDSTDPDMKPMSQMEISGGIEKRLRERPGLHVAPGLQEPAVVHRGHRHRHSRKANTTTPPTPAATSSMRRWAENKALGVIPANAPDIPKAKRLYYGVNLSLDKRFSNNWMGGISYTWSRLTGNYSGLASGDEAGRTSPNVERYFDLWYLAFDKKMNKIDGVMPGDRTHSIKVYGSYTPAHGPDRRHHHQRHERHPGLDRVLHGRPGLPALQPRRPGPHPLLLVRQPLRRIQPQTGQEQPQHQRERRQRVQHPHRAEDLPDLQQRRHRS